MIALFQSCKIFWWLCVNLSRVCRLGKKNPEDFLKNLSKFESWREIMFRIMFRIENTYLSIIPPDYGIVFDTSCVHTTMNHRELRNMSDKVFSYLVYKVACEASHTTITEKQKHTTKIEFTTATRSSFFCEEDDDDVRILRNGLFVKASNMVRDFCN